MNVTHKFNLEVGVDLGSLTTPETMPGVMAYLGVEDKEQLTKSIANDKFARLEKAIESLGMTVISGSFDTLEEQNNQTESIEQIDTKVADDQGVAEESGQTDQVEEEPEIGKELKGSLIKAIKDSIKSIKDDDGKLQELIINEKAKGMVDIKRLKLDEEVDAHFDYMYKEAVVLGYLSKDEVLEYKVINIDELGGS